MGVAKHDIQTMFMKNLIRSLKGSFMSRSSQLMRNVNMLTYKTVLSVSLCWDKTTNIQGLYTSVIAWDRRLKRSCMTDNWLQQGMVYFISFGVGGDCWAIFLCSNFVFYGLIRQNIFSPLLDNFFSWCSICSYFRFTIQVLCRNFVAKPSTHPPPHK